MSTLIMADVRMKNETKDVYIHLGPHKTGSTAVQHFFSSTVFGTQDLFFLHDETTHLAAQKMAQKQYDEAQIVFGSISDRISRLPHSKVFLSQEDFSGDLPGRSRSRKVYPTIGKNIRLIGRWLAPHRVRFLFFRRNTDEWIASCYAQNIRFRHRYHNHSMFKESIDWDDWKSTIDRVQRNFSDVLTVVDYSKQIDAGILKVATWLGIEGGNIPSYEPAELMRNTSLRGEELVAFERINHRAQHRDLIPVYKKRALSYLNSDRPYRLSRDSQTLDMDWPQSISDGGSFIGLEGLTERIRIRSVDQENQPDLLPDLPLNLTELSCETMPDISAAPEVSRRLMSDQVSILQYHMRRQSRLSFINALCVSYLRRNTLYTEKARSIFHYIWENSGIYLVTELSARWLISTLQTFVDHPKSPAQKTIGAVGYFYGNLIKIYEGERALEGRNPDQQYSSEEPVVNSGFRGLDRYKVGGTDLLLNTNALALELSSLDKTSGLILEELLLRTKHSQTVFYRHDITRLSLGINTRPFSDVWSFYEEPTDFDR